MADVTGSSSKDEVHHAPKCCVEGCEKWGSYGFSSSKNAEAKWWCYPHYPHKLEGRS